MKEDIVYEQATSGNVVKLAKKGDFIEGVFVNFEESKQYPSNYALRIAKDGEQRVVFVSGIVIDLLKNNNVEKGVNIKLVFDGKVKTKDGKREYNDYSLFFKK